MPGVEINHGLVPNLEHLASFSRVLTEQGHFKVLQKVDLVPVFALADGQMPQRMTTQIQGVAVPHRSLGFSLYGVVGGGPMPVSVAGIDVELREFVISRQGVGQGLGDPGVHPLIEFDGQAKPARTLQRLEVVTQGGVFPRSVESEFLSVNSYQ